MKTLAVDDEQSIRDLLPLILTDAGIKDVTVASSADRALEVIESQAEPFECFLLDIQMPGITGIELCAKIRELPDYRKTPIIMLTAMREKSYIDDSFAAGATDYITKPFNISEVSARVGMAKRLVAEQRRSMSMNAGSSASTEPSLAEAPINFADEIDLGDMHGVVSRKTFDNYLAQLSRAGVHSTSFFVVHVQSGRKIFKQSTPSEFEYAIRHAADAIIVSEVSGSVIMYYAGSGNFLCSSFGTELLPAEQIEWDIQSVLDEKELYYDNGAPLDIDIAVGAPIQPLLSEPINLEFLKDRAIKRALKRVSEKRTESKDVNIKRVC